MLFSAHGSVNEVGTVVGAKLGKPVGNSVGADEGTTEGSNEGNIVGTVVVGAMEGDKVVRDSNPVGDQVGEKVIPRSAGLSPLLPVRGITTEDTMTEIKRETSKATTNLCRVITPAKLCARDAG